MARPLQNRSFLTTWRYICSFFVAYASRIFVSSGALKKKKKKKKKTLTIPHRPFFLHHRTEFGRCIVLSKRCSKDGLCRNYATDHPVDLFTCFSSSDTRKSSGEIHASHLSHFSIYSKHESKTVPAAIHRLLHDVKLVHHDMKSSYFFVTSNLPKSFTAKWLLLMLRSPSTNIKFPMSHLSSKRPQHFFPIFKQAIWRNIGVLGPLFLNGSFLTSFFHLFCSAQKHHPKMLRHFLFHRSFLLLFCGQKKSSCLRCRCLRAWASRMLT